MNSCKHNSLISLAIGFIFVATASLYAQDPANSPVDRSVELKKKEFSDQLRMADGPMWDGANLIIPDVTGQKLYRYSPKRDTLTQVKNADGRFSASYFNHGRRFLSDNPGSRIAFLDGNQVRTHASFEQWVKPTQGEAPAKKVKPYRPNDLVIDNQGGMYVTFTPQGRVIYIAKDGTQSVAVEGIKSPNGIALSPDGSTLYVSSFVPKEIYSYSIDEPGKTKPGQLFAAMDDGPDRGADGMTVDRAGNVYCAGKSDIWIWSPSGKLLDKIACPSKPINCVFGGTDLRTLYIVGPGAVYEQAMTVAGVTAQAGVVEWEAKEVRGPKPNPSIPSTKLTDYQIGESFFDVTYAQYGDRKLLADLFVPENADNATAIIVVHGGGWHKGDKKKFRALALELCSAGYVTMAIEYRLAEEAAFPAAMHDCSAAVRFLRANAKKYRANPNRMMAVGGSAGGHLVGLMAAGARNPKLQGEGGNPGVSSAIQGAVVMAGPLQIASGRVAESSLKPEARSNARSWMRGTVEEKRDLYLLADAMEQMDRQTCPILFQVGDKDSPERNQPSRDKLTKLGVVTELKVYLDAKHGCWNRLPWLRLFAKDIDSFFKSIED